jgi:RimJ/RimL family protein N-acetyltransferase
MRISGCNLSRVWAALNRPLEGSSVRLELLCVDHRDALYDASRDPRIWTWLGTLEWGSSEPDRPAFDAWFDHALGEIGAHNAVVFVIVDRRLDRVVGSTRYMHLRPRHKALSIAWTWLAPSVWRSGINVESRLLTLENAFERGECRRVEFLADTRNARARGALASLPAQLDGVLRCHMQLIEGERDSACYSIIGEEWPMVRANLEQRLRAHAQARDDASGSVR